MNNENVTIQEEYSLPSKGLIYQTPFDPMVKLRSMTVAEEMKRLTATENPYKTMSDIIEDCLLTKLPVSVYDMCLGDYQYLLHKLRTVTYGSDYKLSIRCPHCGEIFETVIDLDDLVVFDYEEGFNDLKLIKLPVTGDTLEITFQTPRILDSIENKRKNLKKQFPDMKSDPSLMLNLESVIKLVNGQPMDVVSLREYVKKLPMKDTILLLQQADLLNTKVGIDTKLFVQCTKCGLDVNTTFRFTSEFFRPEV